MKAQPILSLCHSECKKLFEVELVIALHELIAANSSSFQSAPFPLADTWSLLTGYVTPELNDDPKFIQSALIVRCRCNYIRTRTAWNHILDWYKTLPEVVRGYRLFPDGSYTRISSPYVPQRTSVIADALHNIPIVKNLTFGSLRLVRSISFTMVVNMSV